MEPRQVYIQTSKGPSLRYEVFCQECGAPRLIHPCRLKEGAGKYCSLKCKNRALARNLSPIIRKTMIRNSAATRTAKTDRLIETVTVKPVREALADLHHRQGLTILEMSRILDLSRRAIERALKRHGVSKRPYYQSGHMKEWHAKHPGMGAIFAEKSHAAMRGKRRSDEWHIRRALAVQEKGKLSPLEQFLLQELQDSNLKPVPLYALYKYNIDLAFPDQRLALEVHGGNWHLSDRKREQDWSKREFLLSRGWSLIYFWPGKARLGSRKMTLLVNQLLVEIRKGLEADHPVEVTVPQPTLP